MSLVTFVSARGAPGVSTVALSVAGVWPSSDGHAKVLLEVDPAGGVLGLRLGLGEDPGLVSLTAAARHGVDRMTLWDHAQELPGGLAVVPGPASSSVAAQVLASAGGRLGEWLSGLGDVDVIADAGRLTGVSPALGFVASSDLVVVVARPVVDQLHAGAELASALVARGVRVGWCLVGEGPYRPADVEAAYGIDVWGAIPGDARGAGLMIGGAPAKKLARTALVRSAASLAAHLSGWLHQPGPSQTPPVPVDAAADGSAEGLGGAGVVVE
jgi:hypothetical protein